MSHKGNFNVTEMGRIALSLQQLIDWQNIRIAKLEEERAEDRKLLNQFRRTNAQLRVKIDKQQEMLNHNLIIIEGQNKVIKESSKLLDDLIMKWPWQRWFRRGK